MADFVDAVEFEEYNRSPMASCSAPDSAEFEDDPNTVIFTNVGGRCDCILGMVPRCNTKSFNLGH